MLRMLRMSMLMLMIGAAVLFICEKGYLVSSATPLLRLENRREG